MKKVEVVVEKDKEGIYWGVSQNIPGVISADGTSFEELKSNFSEAFELAQESDDIYKEFDFDFQFKMSLKDFFKQFPEINKSSLAKRMGINSSLFSQYTATKPAYVSVERIKKIEQEIHKLAEELKTVTF
ncbi:MAG: type II toxin-antitoxin system HicB family antitoxin [Weeksellaceae bacterium]|jgi:predicted RNase H-like HicB family nuclease|nr:type II toxin-antitoxin system HicB family antitoxin [Weeksellaceae bacterium]